MTRGQIAKMIKKSKNHFAKWCRINRRQSDRSENISLRNPTLSVRCLSLSLSLPLPPASEKGGGGGSAVSAASKSADDEKTFLASVRRQSTFGR